VNYARFDLFKPVRFSADIDDAFDPDVSSLEQPDTLLTARLSLRIRALCPGMEFVLAKDFTICLYACNAPTAMEASSDVGNRYSGE